MDLSTVRQRINRKEYTTLHQIRNDITLIFENCKTFNSYFNDAMYVPVGYHMQEFFHCLWQEHMLKSDDGTAAEVSSPAAASVYSNDSLHPCCERTDVGCRTYSEHCWCCCKQDTTTTARMLVCNGCTGTFHLNCLIPRLEEKEIPQESRGQWECPECCLLKSRTIDRTNRLNLTGSFQMKGKYLQQAMKSLKSLIIEINQGPADVNDNNHWETVILDELQKVEQKLIEKIHSQSGLTVSDFHALVKDCYDTSGNKNRRDEIQKVDTGSSADTDNISFLSEVSRNNYLLDQYVAQIVVPIYELKRRGSEYSSIWARLDYGPKSLLWVQSSASTSSIKSKSKGVYWPALLLGIWKDGKCDPMMEDHLPRLSKGVEIQIRKQMTNKTKNTRCAAGGKAYYIVEFLGTHEFGMYSEDHCLSMTTRSTGPSRDDDLNTKRKKKKPTNKSYDTAKKEAGGISKEILLRRGCEGDDKVNDNLDDNDNEDKQVEIHESKEEEDNVLNRNQKRKAHEPAYTVAYV